MVVIDMYNKIMNCEDFDNICLNRLANLTKDSLKYNFTKVKNIFDVPRMYNVNSYDKLLSDINNYFNENPVYSDNNDFLNFNFYIACCEFVELSLRINSYSTSKILSEHLSFVKELLDNNKENDNLKSIIIDKYNNYLDTYANDLSEYLIDAKDSMLIILDNSELIKSNESNNSLISIIMKALLKERNINNNISQDFIGYAKSAFENSGAKIKSINDELYEKVINSIMNNTTFNEEIAKAKQVLNKYIE